jgi:hypothetical protein
VRYARTYTELPVAEILWNECPICNGSGDQNQCNRQMIKKYVPMMISVAYNGRERN